MPFQKNRNIIIPCLLSFFITSMQIIGWHISMDYGSSVHQSNFFQNIGILSTWQYLVFGFLEWILLSFVFYLLFHKLEKRSLPNPSTTLSLNFWILTYVLFIGIWMIALWGCYPGYYNFDIGNQIPQFMYEEVPYNTHHPLLHTVLSGFIISTGYHFYNTDLSFGVFLYNLFQMIICSLCLFYTMRFIYNITKNRILLAISFLFYSFSPTIIMHSMSTTKDIFCNAFLLVGVISLYKLINNNELDKCNKVFHLFFCACALILSCLFRKNIIYSFLLFIILSIFILNKNRKKQILFYSVIIMSYFIINNGLISILNANSGSIGEVLCVPYQQIARLYTIEGPSAFTEEELNLLSKAIPPDALYCYDPVLADHVKSNFEPGLPFIMNHIWKYFSLWLKKGFEYPKIYIDSLLYNTYQAWYPGSFIVENRGIRYFEIGHDWQEEQIFPNWPALYNFLENISNCSYIKYPIIRLLFSIGFMFWIVLITWFYGLWKKDFKIIIPLLLVLLVCATNFCGPISLVRYYLILFYLFPVCLGILFSGKNSKREEI